MPCTTTAYRTTTERDERCARPLGHVSIGEDGREETATRYHVREPPFHLEGPGRSDPPCGGELGSGLDFTMLRECLAFNAP